MIKKPNQAIKAGQSDSPRPGPGHDGGQQAAAGQIRAAGHRERAMPPGR